MKKALIAFVVLCGIIAGAIVSLNQHKTPPPVLAVLAESTPGRPMPPVPPENIVAPRTETQPAIPAEPAKVPAAIPVISATSAEDSAHPVRQAVDALLSAKKAGEKHAVFEQLIKSGQLDAAMVELQQRMAENPNNAQLPTTLGEAQLNKAGVVSRNGGSINEMGILGMQADQNFDTALKLDPANWEAQFFKAVSMSYWPTELNKGPEVIQRLSSLIDQQETMTPNPAFVQTYVVLGNQYQKTGQPDKAAATWLLGLQKFPSDPTLLKKVNGQ